MYIINHNAILNYNSFYNNLTIKYFVELKVVNYDNYGSLFVAMKVS